MKHLYEIEAGARFQYGGVEWINLAMGSGAVLALAAEPVFDRAFDGDNCNNWETSSLRRELNGAFLDALGAEGADKNAFLTFVVDLTADDGMKDYETTTDKIALISCDQYRQFRKLIPPVDCWWWTLTPWTCDPEYSYHVRGVISSGALNYNGAYGGFRGVRPLCNLKYDILVSIPGEENEPTDTAAARSGAVEDARDELLSALEDYPADIWGDALGAAVASILTAKTDAEEGALEERARRAQE